jgi:hypothetical protein
MSERRKVSLGFGVGLFMVLVILALYNGAKRLDRIACALERSQGIETQSCAENRAKQNGSHQEK